MNNKVNYPRWVAKLKRQLKREKEEVAELNKCLSLWMGRAIESQQTAAALSVECEKCKTLSDGFYMHAANQNKHIDGLLSTIEMLTTANAKLAAAKAELAIEVCDLRHQLRKSHRQNSQQ